jgi:hypothetical protein
MDPIIKINERIEVAAVFRKQGDFASLCMPCKMRYKNIEIVITEIGMRHPTKAGRRMIHVFDVTDGVNDYRIEFDAEALSWTLMGIMYGGDRELRD